MALNPATGDIYVAGVAQRPGATSYDPDYAVVKYDKELGQTWVSMWGLPSQADHPQTSR